MSSNMSNLQLQDYARRIPDSAHTYVVRCWAMVVKARLRHQAALPRPMARAAGTLRF